jgi:hypothetical protein
MMIFDEEKIVITYEKDGLFVPDHKVEETAIKIINDGKDVSVSQSLLVDYIRVVVKERKMDNVVFKFEDNILYCDENGFIDYWPIGFCDYQTNALDKLIEWGKP